MTRRPLIAGNWKLHKTVAESVTTARALHHKLLGGVEAEVVIAPVFTAVHAVAQALQGSPVRVSAQDCFWETKGAFTGEISAGMLAEAGCRYCIVGHSERRQMFNETDETVKKKVAALLEAHLTPIICCGETLAQREAGQTLDVVLAQIDAALSDVSQPGAVVLAYEPIWAIGTGRTASPSDAQQVHAAIRGAVERSHGASGAANVRILYGGSVKPANADGLFAEEDIDGGLVGGASLDADSFAAIVGAASRS